MRLHRGVHPQLEAAADALLADELRKVTSHRAKSDILTPWKAQDRRRREVYVASGTPDPSLRSGIFSRATNPAQPHLNSATSASLKQHRQFKANQGYSREGAMSTPEVAHPEADVTISWDDE